MDINIHSEQPVRLVPLGTHAFNDSHRYFEELLQLEKPSLHRA